MGSVRPLGLGSWGREGVSGVGFQVEGLRVGFRSRRGGGGGGEERGAAPFRLFTCKRWLCKFFMSKP